MKPITGFDFFDEVEEAAPLSKRDEAAMLMSSLKKGDTFKLGGTRWTVFLDQGAVKLVTKAGTKGKKLYVVRAAATDEFEVREVIEGGANYSSSVEAQGLIIPELKHK